MRQLHLFTQTSSTLPKAFWRLKNPLPLVITINYLSTRLTNSIHLKIPDVLCSQTIHIDLKVFHFLHLSGEGRELVSWLPKAVHHLFHEELPFQYFYFVRDRLEKLFLTSLTSALAFWLNVIPLKSGLVWLEI